MAASAGATISSCFSTAATTTATSTCRSSSKHYATPSDFVLLRIACNGNYVRVPALQAGSSSISYSQSSLLDSICKITTSSPPTTHKMGRAAFRISATIEQEEVSAATEIESSSSSVIDDGEVEEKTNEKEEETEEENVEVSGDQAGGGETSTESATNTKLYFGNLPYNCDSAQLAGIIQEYGSPEMVEVLYDRDTGRSRGFAFVTMSSLEDANAVIKNLDGSEYGGRTLKVNFSDKPKPKQPLYPESDYKLFVGNLSWTVTSESLIQAFQEYGNIVGARVLYDGETGQSRGYGFVCYSTKEEMDAALVSLNGMELDGRAMRISPAQGKRN